jgi:hypothetical protein
VPLTGDAPLFEMIERPASPAERGSPGRDMPLYELPADQDVRMGSLQDLRGDIFTYKPESVAGALALCGMVDECG